MFDLFLLACVHGLLLCKLLGTLCFKLAVVASENSYCLMFDVCDARTDFIQKVTVMRNYQQNSLVTL